MRDIRDFIAKCEEEGQLHRIKAEVDWNLELSHIAKINEERKGPALLFENVKDYSIPVLTSAMSTTERLAIILGQPTSYSSCQLSQEWMKLVTKGLIPPKVIDKGPIMENIIGENEVDIESFPAPYFYPLDGGRYIGTANFLITQDPETGWTNLGTYRGQILDKKHIGIQIIKGKHADFVLNQYKNMGKKMPAAMVVGFDPILLACSGTMISAQISEYDIAGALRGEPIEVIESDLTGLKIPAYAEIVLEGEINPEKLRPEGPFGEYTGYYSGSKGEDWPKPCLEVKRILHRNNPIFMATTVGKPITDTHMLLSLQRTASLWTDLEAMRIPGIQSVYIPANSTGRFWAIVSVKTMYPGHSNQVGNAVIATTTGHYGLKGVIVVDEDIPADNWDKVMWALSVRYDPHRDTDIIKRGRSTPLDPALPIEAREITSRIIMDATIPYEWEEKPIEISMVEDIKKRVLARWKEFGFDDGAPPKSIS
ncbi:MAG: phenylphosphate carboxylase subunit beta [Deltaproteobacteria bacterium]|nr:phenylphosphate carboxylase subunit beta [Deltaproteobacteria bacterium]MBW2044422.1 phenylphosphate carboxylase subunit beta [Deltaproteobacteria bacterium]